MTHVPGTLRTVRLGAIGAALVFASAGRAEMTGVCADVHAESFIGQPYWTIDVYALFDTDADHVVGFTGVAVSSSAGGSFHHTEAHDSWSPTCVPALFLGLTDSFVTVGNEFGETNTWTAPGADWGPLGFDRADFPASASWANSDPSNGAGQAAVVSALGDGTCLDGTLAGMIGRFVVSDEPTTFEIAGTVEWTIGLLGAPQSTPFALSVDVGGTTPTCPADLDGNGEVNGADLGLMLGAWGPCDGCPADLNADGAVDGADLGELLAAWGPCPA
ncbi:MAG: hypothetical protein KDA22_11720 [Phycisphaerales bacterium]|nr:hypothetical protein [Phycisphaerales bacterium]